MIPQRIQESTQVDVGPVLSVTPVHARGDCPILYKLFQGVGVSLYRVEGFPLCMVFLPVHVT